MKKQLLLVITIGYAMLAPLSIHACPGSSIIKFQEYEYNEMPQCLNDSIKNACNNYVSTTARNGALYAGGLIGGASAAWLCYDPNARTARNISLAMAGTAIGSGLSYWLRKTNASSNVTSHDRTLTVLTTNHNNLLLNSIVAVGANHGFDIPTIDTFQAKKQHLETLFEDSDIRKGSRESNSCADILNAYGTKASPEFGVIFTTPSVIEQKINNHNEANQVSQKIMKLNDDILKEFKDYTYLAQIISDAQVKKNIELNLALHRSLYNLHGNMANWLRFIKGTQEYHRAMARYQESERAKNQAFQALLGRLRLYHDPR